MEFYTLQCPLTFTTGLIGLSDDQAAKRADRLEPQKRKGVYSIVQPVQFKVGEVVGFHKLPKVFAPSLEVVKTKADEK